jgi:Pentapeptide repeats (8 copies)
LRRWIAKFLRRPVVLFVIGVVVTNVVAIGAVIVLLRTGDAQAVSDNAPLIAAVIALGGVGTAQMVSIALEDQRTREARALEDQRTQEAHELEAQRAREAALQNYFEVVGELLIEKPLRRASLGDNLSTVVRAQTLSVLEGLDPDRKRILLLFLYESGLIHKDKPVVSLVAAKLSEANLSEAKLSSADLLGTNLLGTNLSRADLSRANLMDANVSRANLSDAKLGDADLSDADLSDALGITNEELEQQAKTLKGATMPDGQRYQDWLKDREKRQQDE